MVFVELHEKAIFDTKNAMKDVTDIVIIELL